MVSPTDAGIHLHLRGRMDEGAVTALRQQLALCLANGVAEIAVHVDAQPHLDLAVLRTLHGAAEYLATRGGALFLVGAHPAVVSTLHVYELDHLLRRPVTHPGSRQAEPAAGRPRAAARRARPRVGRAAPSPDLSRLATVTPLRERPGKAVPAPADSRLAEAAGPDA